MVLHGSNPMAIREARGGYGLSFQPGMEPQKTIDGSGLTGDLHGTGGNTCGLSSALLGDFVPKGFSTSLIRSTNGANCWSGYSNQPIETFLALGPESHDRTSSDGKTWAPVPPCRISPATGAVGYAEYKHRQFSAGDGQSTSS